MLTWLLARARAEAHTYAAEWTRASDSPETDLATVRRLHREQLHRIVWLIEDDRADEAIEEACRGPWTTARPPGPEP